MSAPKLADVVEAFRVAYMNVSKQRMEQAIKLVLIEDEIARCEMPSSKEKRRMELELSAAKNNYASVKLEVDALMDTIRAEIASVAR